MDFAKKQLEKYGWTDGKGLGKNEDGITAPIKPKLKFDNAGIGHEIGKEFTNNWWENLFNKASNNIDVKLDGNDVKLKLKSSESVEITTKSYSVKDFKKKKSVKYGSFIKTAKLTQTGIETYENAQETASSTIDEDPNRNFQTLTDEQLFAACGGRTAHKGARHGLKLSGKLSRLEKQEKLLLKKMKTISLTDNNNIDKLEKKVNKLKKQKEDCLNKANMSEIDLDINTSSSSASPSAKKKKKRKSVTFNDETITKYYTPDSNLTCDNNTTITTATTTTIRDENGNEENGSRRLMVEPLETNGFDEGIEQDIEEGNTSEPDDNHKSFEQVQCNFNDLSKAERQKLKKKRKLEKKNGATMKFLSVVMEDISIDDDNNSTTKYNKRKKRKLIFDDLDNESKSNQSMKESKKTKYITEKRKKKKEKRKEKKLINTITKSLDSICRISDDE